MEKDKVSIQVIYDKMDYEGWPDVLTWFNSDEIEDDRLANLWDEARGLYEDLEMVKDDIDNIINAHLYPKVADNEELSG